MIYWLAVYNVKMAIWNYVLMFLILVMSRWPQHNADVQNKLLWYCFAVIWSKPCIHMNILMEVFLLFIVKQVQPFDKIYCTEIDHISSLLPSSLHCWRHSSQSTLCQKSECLKWLTGRGRLWLAIKSAGHSHDSVSLFTESSAFMSFIMLYEIYIW